ncbi:MULTISPECIES: thioredoxin [Massilia]|uniref:thioredoxin n=2 Tax=Pseudomonadota TaxID=1224 RepID=UPI002354BB20|nr:MULTISPECIES: thioredoxin [Massilia]MDN4038934.1 thioredoxin [Massilia sp. YIM B02443]
MLRAIVHTALLAACVAGSGASAQHTALPASGDLAADGHDAAQRRVPLVILFSLPDCSYCETVRRNYLLPLSREGVPGQRPIIREAGLASTAPLRGFDKQASSGKALASRYGIRVAPSVAILDGHGKLLVPVLEGGDVAGMYGAYLDEALAGARRALAASKNRRTE